MLDSYYNPGDGNDNVPHHRGNNVLISKEVHGWSCRLYVTKDKIEDIAIQNYRSRGNGITFRDLARNIPLNKSKAQRRLKHFHIKGVLFTAEDLINQGIYLIQNTNPQQYFPACIKAEIIEALKKRKNVLVEPTGVICSRYPLSNAIESQKAQNFLDILGRLPLVPISIHKLQMVSVITKEYYTTLKREPRPGNKAKVYEECIGKTLTKYAYSPNGTVEIAITCSNNPFKLATEEDVCMIFSFFGQVRDRMLYHLSDPRERVVPPIIYWCLVQCDVNKDIEINDKMQLTLPDIQLRNAGRVFRAYVKLLGERAACRVEESLKVDLPLTDALDNIRNPNKELERKVDHLIELVERALKR
jgi:hypothetical protein